MQLLCHRGVWSTRGEQNTLAAFRRAWDNGWGIETDLRDHQGRVVVSHDPARDDALPLEQLLDEHGRHGGGSPLALNIKADGLAAPVAHALTAAGTDGAFVFDMSVPDALSYLKAGVPTWTRWSDVEPDPVLLEQSSGVWVDAFASDAWWTASELAAAATERPLCIVSPELHGRAPELVWEQVADLPVSLCTDRPFDVERSFS